MIASLGMYDLPWLRAANDALWAGIAARLRRMDVAEVPDRLTRDRPLDDLWRAPDLLMAQTCGYPLVTTLPGDLQLVATPRYRAEGCRGATHRSAIIIRSDLPVEGPGDLAGRRLALNGADSNSGMNLLRGTIARHAGGGSFFGAIVPTGAHLRSIAAVLSGRADVAAVDAVTLAHVRARYPRRTRALRILAWTDPSPGLPIVTAASTPPATLAALRRALGEAAADPALADAVATLRIAGFDVLPRSAYDVVRDIERSAVAAGYPAIA